MKKADYNRVLSLYKNSNVSIKLCIQMLLQMSTNSQIASEHIMIFLKDAGVIK